MKQKILNFIKLMKKVINPYLKSIITKYKELLEKLRKIEFDKYLHFNVCFILTLTIISLIDIVLPSLFAIILGPLFAFLIGTSKELWDRQSYGLFDFEDLKADIYGILFGIGYYLWFKFCLVINL